MKTRSTGAKPRNLRSEAHSRLAELASDRRSDVDGEITKHLCPAHSTRGSVEEGSGGGEVGLRSSQRRRSRRIQANNASTTNRNREADLVGRGSEGLYAHTS